MNFLDGSVFFGASLTDYFVQSNFAGQVIVVVLLIFSVLAWGVMFCKNMDLKSMGQLNAQTSQAVSKAKSLVDASEVKSLSGPYASLLRDGVSAWERAGFLDEDKSVRIAHVENTLQRTLSKQLIKYDSKMTLLGTIISGAPFLGLLGTAWGVMDCFGSMSAQTSVTLQMLAPGVAGALLTTVAGLVVAIPSVFGYNYLTTISRNMTTETENFASTIADRIEIESRALNVKNNETKAQPQVQASVQHVQQMPAVVQLVVQPTPVQPPTPVAPVAAAAPVVTSSVSPAASEPAASPVSQVEAKSKSLEPEIIKFSLDDDDDSRPTLTRDFDE